MRKISRGVRAERELARKLWSAGLAVVRGPASGAGARHIFYPDMVVMYRGRIAVLEVKYRGQLGQRISIGTEKMEKLLAYAERAGAEAFLAVKLPTYGWRFVKLSSSTPATLKVDDVIREGLTIDSFIRYMKAPQITSYIRESDG